MATAPRIRRGMSLEEFLKLPAIDEHPYLEFIDGNAPRPSGGAGLA